MKDVKSRPRRKRRSTQRVKTTGAFTSRAGWRVVKRGNFAQCRSDALRRMKAGSTARVGKISNKWTTVVKRKR